MRLAVRVILCVLAVLSVCPQAFADSLWDHNGSVMRLVANGNQRFFYYEVPRPGMVEQGVRPGTLFFDGERHGSRITGTARAFSNKCAEPMSYRISGDVVTELRIVLHGRRPTFKNCRPTGTLKDDVLVLTYLRTLDDSAAQQAEEPAQIVAPPLAEPPPAEPPPSPPPPVAVMNEAAIPEIGELVSLLYHDHLSYGDGSSPPGIFTTLEGRDLPFDTRKGRCSIAVKFLFNQPRGGETNFDGSQSVTVLGDVVQIDFSFLSLYTTERDLIGKRKAYCIAPDENNSCTETRVGFSVTPRKGFFRSAPLWKQGQGPAFIPTDEQLRDVSSPTGIKAYASYYVGGNLDTMDWVFRPADIDRGAELMKRIMAQCGDTSVEQ